MIDPNRIAELKALSGADPSLLNELIDLYASSTPPHMKAIRAALARRDAEKMEKSSHALRSASVNLGANELAALCEELELKGRNRDLSGAAPLVERLENCYDEIVRNLLKLKE